MPALYGTADAAHPRPPGLAPLRRLHPKAGRVGQASGRAVAIRPIGPRAGQVARIRGGHGNSRRRRLYDHRLQDRLGLHAIVRPRLGHDGPQRQAVFIGR